MRDESPDPGRRRLLRAALALAGAASVSGLAGCAQDVRPALSAQDSDDVARVEAYLNRLGAFEARFEQVWPDGGESTGTAFFLAPDRLRLVYDPPTRMVMVAAAGKLVLHNYANESVTRVGLSGNPLGLLLRKPVTLSGAITVTSVQRAPGVVALSLARTDNPAQGLLTLTFADSPLLLTGIEMVDAAGHDTRLRFSSQRRPDALDPSLFDTATA
ncbi:outer membrane lipoprotein-sorting protein [Endobacter medicaginis]|uniref:Outer membrane lipoprotein carrier protein LolA n=1 Tax=Endobacter medicaginis TaxID=1181271 RepID=A0A839UXJ7_9PROT|nr:outer membrane lipoprotein carrier protein LolA [Endobacter medicaginis]MBB3175078.1 outer membrane lipoprotein-sorting protein [Endobacter medicaginis]MCX5476214.1 outer membrane lipoprotein carrier protein LolA [Endobacter medicaginis]NVN29773.1 outer membrane lipoprotein carrier protein LolA [Endobacter medicaginis]